MTDAAMPAAPDPSFDRYARIVHDALAVPMALVSIVQSDRQVLPGAIGLPQPWQDERCIPLTHSFCQYVVTDGAALIVSDARLDGRLKDNPAIVDLNMVAYAGYPILDASATIIGSLSAIDSQPRQWSAQELQTLADLAATCSTEFRLRDLRSEADSSAQLAQYQYDRSRVLLDLSETLTETVTLTDIAAGLQTVSAQLGCNHAGIWVLGHSRDTAMRYVVHPTLDWPQAERAGELGADASNPIGRATSGRRPLFYRSRADQDRDFPVHASPAQPGDGQARAFMPLIIQGQPLGCLALLWPQPRAFTDADRITIAALASYTAQAIQRAVLVEEQRNVATTLQEAMLSPLPRLDDLDLAARYLTAAAHDQVGGDWYDAVQMPSGATNIVIGDVVGHDITAAAKMGQLRNMLRAMAWAIDDPPAANVARLDRAARDLHLDTMATLVFARIEQTPADRRVGRRTLRWTNAGHPPPLLVAADGTVTILNGDSIDLLLGCRPETQRHDHSVEVGNGATLLLYTDGLIERRDRDLDAGLAQLADALGRYHPLPVGKMLESILASTIGHEPEDDVAVLAVRFNAQ
jgi:serine phosphatase RsbU (regulator of sigma subunit)